jgi:hypothetical protein
MCYLVVQTASNRLETIVEDSLHEMSEYRSSD